MTVNAAKLCQGSGFEATLTYVNRMATNEKQYVVKFNVKPQQLFTIDYELKQQKVVKINQNLEDVVFQIQSDDRIEFIMRSMFNPRQQMSKFETFLSQDHRKIILRKYPSIGENETKFDNTFGGQLRIQVQNEKGDTTFRDLNSRVIYPYFLMYDTPMSCTSCLKQMIVRFVQQSQIHTQIKSAVNIKDATITEKVTVMPLPYS